MLAVAWYGWVGIALATIVLILFLSLRYFRAGVRRDLLAFLAKEYPDVEVTRVRNSTLELRVREATGTWNIRELFVALATLTSQENTPEKQREIFREFADDFINGMREVAEPTNIKRVGKRILVRLVPPDWPDSLPPDHKVPTRLVESLGLRTVYVIDSPNSVRYVTEDDLNDLGLDLLGVHRLALDNLRERFSPDPVREAVRKDAIVTIKAMDSFDAARLLLVPEFLKEGEELAALIPDRDTLTLVPIPVDGDWKELRKLARVPASEHLLIDRPLKVSREGFEVV
jgi:uncharacterized protein YtpQ (UPF0354 family)